MKGIDAILRDTSHRPFPPPRSRWRYYREWRDVLFFHWKVPAAAIRKSVPAGLELDLLNGEAWISLVIFESGNLHSGYFPSFPPVSVFIELDVRTYVTRNDKPGICFLSLEAGKSISASLAGLVTGLKYHKSVMTHHAGFYESENIAHLSYLKAVYSEGGSYREKNDDDRWLTDRFCVFNEMSGDIYSHDIHHRDWPLKTIDVKSLEVNYRSGDLLINRNADLFHFSSGVKVISWGNKKA